MSAQERELLISPFREFKDVFAFRLDQVHELDPTIIEHHLNADPAHTRVMYKNKYMGTKWCAATVKGVLKLLDAGFIQECQ